MRNTFTAVLALLALTSTAFAGIQGSPYPPEVDSRFNDIESLASTKVMVGSSAGVATDVTVTGDVTIGNTGVTAVGAGKILESMLQIPTAEALGAKRIARVTYDVAVDLGTVAAHALGVTLPAKSIILQTWFYTVTQFVDAGAGTVAISCEDANNLYTATDITGIAVGTITAGAADGHAAATFVGSIAAACEVTATVATAAQSAGKLIFFIEYVVVE